MSTTFTLDTSTSRANPTPAPMKRLTVPAIQRRKFEGKTAEPLVMLTAYTARQAQLLDPHCDLLLVGDSLGQVIYGLPSTLGVTLDMMCAHGAAVVRGSYHSVVIIDMPFGSYEASPQAAFASASRIMADASAVAQAGAFAVVLEGVMEELAVAITDSVDIPVIGIGASAHCDGQVLVTEDMLGMFERTARFVKRYENIAATIDGAAERYAADVRARSFPTDEQVYRPKK